MDETQNANQIGRDALAKWQQAIQHNVYTSDNDFIHTIRYYFKENFDKINAELEKFGLRVATELEPLVALNHNNLPQLVAYDGIGDRVDQVAHHPSYAQAGDIIYSSQLMAKIAKPGGLLEGLSLFFLSSHAGEAGHNCPIACSAGIMRVLRKVPEVPNSTVYLEKLTSPSYKTNFTGAQFLTEVQGGSDVGLNATRATQESDNLWRIQGEKWFCSNAGAELIFITARYDEKIPGTKGLGLFLIPAEWQGAKNHYTLRRLKEKFGTRTMATAEIDFHGAYAYQVGQLDQGINLVMDNVLHISRLFNSFCVLGMAHRAYTLARDYAKNRVAFSHPILDYPLVQEILAKIKTENMAMIAGIYATTRLQDQLDSTNTPDENSKLLVRLLVNIQKYLTAINSVEHIHQALGILAGNGTIETFSSFPRLFSDCIVCENWEGTHNVLRAQVLRDIHKFDIDKVYFAYMHDEIKKIPSSNSQIITDELLGLEQEMLLFRKLDQAVQALQIRLIVDRMATLFCSLRLLFEAIDQEKTQASTVKLDCFKYYCLLHLGKKDIPYNSDYLKLITRIIA